MAKTETSYCAENPAMRPVAIDFMMAYIIDKYFRVSLCE